MSSRKRAETVSSRVWSGSRLEGPAERWSLTRRMLLQRAAAGTFALSAGGLLEACGAGAVHHAANPASRFEPSPGAEIPSVDVRFAMAPFGDSTIGFIGIDQGFFEDVGINLAPGEGETRLLEQMPGELLSGQLDLSSGYMPVLVQSFANQPEIKMIQLHDVYVGNYLLASPSVGAKPYEYFSRAGEPFDQAAESAVEQIKGKRVALSTVGSNRAFFTTLLGFTGLTPNDVELTVVDDTKILQLARAGDLDFAMPAGAAQNVVLIDEGFFRVFGIGQLLRNLHPGDPRAVTSLGHAGVMGTDNYIARNTETLLRFMSVYYRIIDQVQRDPDTALAVVLPHLNAATGLDLTLADGKAVFNRFYDFISFEETADHLLNKHFPLQLDNVYKPQIEAAKKAGLIKATDNVTPEGIFVGTRFYRLLTALKKRYEDLKGSATSKPALAATAQTQYRNRNYLDAYRLLRSATAG